jgi:hypothetical protein
MKAVEIVKIDKLIPIFKGDEAANAIEVARISTLNGDSCEFNIIVQKGLYNINDNVIYIQPDFCLPDNDFFVEYHRPGGDPKKSRLGKNGRIRAIKFNFSFEGMNDPIYSNGVIMPLNIFNIDNIYDIEDLQTELCVTKYVSEDSFENSQNTGLTKGDFPSFMYKTDEERIENLKSHINRVAESGMEIAATIKRDGSSITIYDRKNPLVDNENEFGICTRNQEKKLEQKYISAYKNDNGVVLRPHFDRETKTKGWFDDSKDKFYTQTEVDELGFESIEQFVKDTWVDTVKENNYLDKLREYCAENNVQLALRGELIGAGNKGSGNKLNTDAKLNKSHIVWFGVDDLSSGRSVRINYSSEHNLTAIGEKLNLDVTKPVFTGVFTYDELVKRSNEFFNYIKETEGRIIEGLVFRSMYDNSLSTKYINPEYDSRS